MKVLWIVNKPIGALHEKLYGKKSTGGLWMEAMLEKSRTDKAMNIVIVNISKISKIQKYVYNSNEIYYTIPGEPNAKYKYKSAKAHYYWRTIINEEKPDLIELWGTEMPFGIPALEEAPNIPSVIYVQGILESIGRYYCAGLTPNEIKKTHTIRDIFTSSSIEKTQKDYLKRAALEAKIASLSKNIIVESHWAESYYLKMSNNIRVFKCPLSISEVFSTVEWTVDKMQPYSIMCSAANYPIKGLHMLLKAVNLVKTYFPNIKLYIPGTPLRPINSIQSWVKQNGYDKLIHSLISEMNLENIVCYTGRLTAEKMAQEMAKMNAFVMCSAIENHSSTLKEAMSVGVPCVSSYVGGVPEYAQNEKNCLLYRFEDYEHLALNIIRLFQSRDLCCKLSSYSRMDMKRNREENDCYQISKKIYKTILGE